MWARRVWVPIIRSWALTRGFALHPGTSNRYEIRYTRTQHRPASRQVNDHGRVSGTRTPGCDDSLVSDGDTVWVTDRGKAKVFASELAGGARRADLEFDRVHRIVEPLRRTGRASI